MRRRLNPSGGETDEIDSLSLLYSPFPPSLTLDKESHETMTCIQKDYLSVGGREGECTRQRSAFYQEVSSVPVSHEEISNW